MSKLDDIFKPFEELDEDSGGNTYVSCYVLDAIPRQQIKNLFTQIVSFRIEGDSHEADILKSMQAILRQKIQEL